MTHNILLWGTGERARNYIKAGYFKKCNILGCVDTYKKSDSFMDYKVYTLADMREIIESLDYVVIANRYFAEILALCAESGINWEKVIITDNVQEPFFQELFQKLKIISE